MIRIALVHSFYSSKNPSGENRVVESEVRALKDAGHDVRLLAAHTDDRESRVTNRLTSAFRVATGAGHSPLAAIEHYSPDVVHVHNLFPNWASRWVGSVRVPVVATLHNFRPLCANGLLFREGQTCTLCPDGDRFAGVRHKCYRDSSLASLPLAIANRQGPMGHPLLRSAQRVIVLSAQAREIYSESGVPESKLIVWPNFLPLDLDPGKAPANGGGARWLFVGRLSAEKGILRLLRAWPSHVPLMVIGDGEERASVEAAARGKDVEFMGPVTREAVVDAMRGSIGLVFPSECFESFPMVYAEAMGAGLPVLAWGPNVVAALVSEHGTGDSVTWKDDLPAVLARAGERFPELRDHCRAVFERDLSEDAYLRRAEALYEDVLINP